jgi:hypothetical protein
MPRGKRLSQRDIEIIGIVYNENRASKAEVIRQLVIERLGRKLALSTVQRELAILKKKNVDSTDPLDNQWSLASLRNYPLPAPAIQLLLYLQATWEDNTPDDIKAYAFEKYNFTSFLTNRLAIWIARLLILFELEHGLILIKSKSLPKDEIGLQTSSKPSIKWPEPIDELVWVSIWYSNYEIACELEGVKPVNTINFDAPTIGQIKNNILAYNHHILVSKGIKPPDYPSDLETLKRIDVIDLLSKGDKRNARTYNKKR